MAAPAAPTIIGGDPGGQQAGEASNGLWCDESWSSLQQATGARRLRRSPIRKLVGDATLPVGGAAGSDGLDAQVRGEPVAGIVPGKTEPIPGVAVLARRLGVGAGLGPGRGDL